MFTEAVIYQKRYDLKNVKQVLRSAHAHDTFGHIVLLDYRPNIRSGRFYV